MQTEINTETEITRRFVPSARVSLRCRRKHRSPRAAGVDRRERKGEQCTQANISVQSAVNIPLCSHCSHLGLRCLIIHAYARCRTCPHARTAAHVSRQPDRYISARAVSSALAGRAGLNVGACCGALGPLAASLTSLLVVNYISGQFGVIVRAGMHAGLKVAFIYHHHSRFCHYVF